MPVPLLPAGTLELANPKESWDSNKYYIPVLGSYYYIKAAYENPTLGNIISAGLSTGGDLLSLLGVGAAIKALSHARRATKLTKQITPLLNAENNIIPEVQKAINSGDRNTARKLSEVVDDLQDKRSPLQERLSEQELLRDKSKRISKKYTSNVKKTKPDAYMISDDAKKDRP